MTDFSAFEIQRSQVDTALFLVLSEVRRELETDICKRIEITKCAETRIQLEGVFKVLGESINRRVRI